MARSHEYLTSSAVRSVPSWNTTPSRMGKVKVRPSSEMRPLSIEGTSLARPGISSGPSGPTSTRRSYTWVMMVSPPSPGSTWAGSTVVPSSSAARTITPGLETSPPPPPVVSGAEVSSGVVVPPSSGVVVPPSSGAWVVAEPSSVVSSVPVPVQAAATSAITSSSAHQRMGDLVRFLTRLPPRFRFPRRKPPRSDRPGPPQRPQSFVERRRYMFFLRQASGSSDPPQAPGGRVQRFRPLGGDDDQFAGVD